MHANRIALAFVLAGLAAPAFAEKCSVCDFSDEPIVVKPKQSSGTPSVQLQEDDVFRRPGRFGWKDQQASPAGGTPSVGEIVVTKLNDVSSPSFDRDRPVLRGTVPNTGAVARYDLTAGWPSKAPAAPALASERAAALPQPAQEGGMGAGKVNLGDFSFVHRTNKSTAPALAGSAPTVGTNAAPAGPGFRR